MQAEKTSSSAMVHAVVIGQLCGCGKPVRYIVPNGDGTADSCNKYARCPSWDELKDKYDELRAAAWAFAEEPLDRNTYTLDHAKRKRLRDALSGGDQRAAE
jgi:hypothetical protein